MKKSICLLVLALLSSSFVLGQTKYKMVIKTNGGAKYDFKTDEIRNITFEAYEDDNNGDDNGGTTSPFTNGALIINNGSVSAGIYGSLTFLDLSTNPAGVQQNVYQTANGQSLGGTPNDVIVHGDKIYIAGCDENTVFVLNRKTFKQIQRISTTDALGTAEGINPRHLIGYADKVYVTTYGGYVAVVDTTSLSITNKYKVGSAPEGMTLGGSETELYLYVANSDYGMGNGSISVININNGKITEIKNEMIHYPQEVAVAGTDIYVLDWGYYDENWNQVNAGVYKISGNTVTKVVPDATGMATYGSAILTFNYPWGAKEPTYSYYDIVYNQLSSIKFVGGNPIQSPAAIAIDPNTGCIFIASRDMNPYTGYPSYTTPGYLNIYDPTFNFYGTTSYVTGVEPHAIAFIYK